MANSKTMNHHVNEGAECPLCAEKLKDAHEELVNAFEKIKAKWPDCHISWTFRDQKDQDEFYREGKTKVKWPKSAHNKHPSWAMDLFRLDSDNVAHFDPSYFKAISDYLIESLIPIEWAGTWTKFREYDHFQLNPTGE